jgi:hypothetical protein
VLAEDPTACYAGLLQKLRTKAGADKTEVVIFAATIVKKSLVFVYGITPCADSGSVDRALAMLKGTSPSCWRRIRIDLAMRSGQPAMGEPRVVRGRTSLRLERPYRRERGQELNASASRHQSHGELIRKLGRRFVASRRVDHRAQSLHFVPRPGTGSRRNRLQRDKVS